MQYKSTGKELSPDNIEDVARIFQAVTRAEEMKEMSKEVMRSYLSAEEIEQFTAELRP